MNQETFIRDFQEALGGKVSEHIIRENTEYYRNYIRTQIGQGMAEEEVLRTLGEPRLLAKTVVESQKFSGETQGAYSEYHGQSQGGYYTEETQVKKYGKAQTWLFIILAILVILAVLKFAFSVLRFFAPVIIMGAVLLFAIKVLKNIFGS